MNHNNANVLIVDDDPAIHRMIGRILRRQPLELFPAQGGSGAFEIARSVLPDLILLDLSMPHIDGFEVAERIKTDLKGDVCTDLPIANVLCPRLNSSQYLS